MHLERSLLDASYNLIDITTTYKKIYICFLDLTIHSLMN